MYLIIGRRLGRENKMSSLPVPTREEEHQRNKTIQKQIIYAACLLVALYIIQVATDASVFLTVMAHEPSIRIFRSLLEVFLLLCGTAASITVWKRYLGVSTTHSLLFYHPPFLEAPSANLHDDDDSHQFDDVHSDDLFESSDDDGDDDTVDEETPKNKLTTDGETSKLPLPSPLSIFSGAMELLNYILIALVFYTLFSVQDFDGRGSKILSRVAAPTFPLLLFLFLIVKLALYLRRNFVLVRILSFTLWAPYFTVSFRDGMIGDILTSTVRPLQDIAFTIMYVLFGISGWWSSSYYDMPESSQTARQFITLEQSDAMTSSSNTFVDIADANVPAMERSWILHTVVLPACMVSPLWYRFLQTLRQVHDTKTRWPYLGNSFKYFFAAQVAMVGVYHPNMKQNPVWLLSFVVATLYQIYWDLVMDWGLFAREGGRWKLRSRRLYPQTSFYYTLIVVNTLLRFCWTLSFLPLRYLSASGSLQNSFSGDTWSSILASTIASAEIIRRTLWALLRVEFEAIKTQGELIHKGSDVFEDDGLEMTPMKLEGGEGSARSPLRFPRPSLQMSVMNEVHVMAELCLYSVAFAVSGLLIAAHRGTQ